MVFLCLSAILAHLYKFHIFLIRCKDWTQFFLHQMAYVGRFNCKRNVIHKIRNLIKFFESFVDFQETDRDQRPTSGKAAYVQKFNLISAFFQKHRKFLTSQNLEYF